MPMPSLLKYFAVVGSALLGLLLFVNYLVAPDAAPAPRAAAPAIVVQHDPQASKIERWRDDQAAIKAAQRPEPVPAALPQGEPLPATAPTLTQAEPPQIVAPASLTTPAPIDAETARLQQRAKLKVAQARKARIARERAQRIARAQEMTRHQQDDLTAYAPRPAFGPFAWGREQ